MDENTRACVAYIAGALVNGNCGNAIYDHSQSKLIQISGTVERNHVNIYDHDRCTFMTGALSDLYDFWRNSTISLSIKGNKISGHDHGDDHDFSGIVQGSLVDISHNEITYCYSL